MSTYFLFGKYQNNDLKNATADRTNTCKEITTKYGGDFINCWALMGDWDIICQVNFPDNETAMKCAVAWNKCTGMDWIRTHQGICGNTQCWYYLFHVYRNFCYPVSFHVFL